MKTKEDLIFSVVALEGLLKVEGLYEDVLRIMDEYADQVKNCNIHDVSISVCPKCHASEVYENRNGDGECAVCGHTWQTGC